MWLVLGGIAFVAALRAGRSRRALEVGRYSLALLMIVFGAAVNAVYLLTDGHHYDTFADDAQLGFVTDTWRSLVVPHDVFFISLLIAGELGAGVLLLLGGRWAETGLVALIGFHVGQLFFGWFLWLWALPMILTFGLLLRAQRRVARPARRAHAAPWRHRPATA